VSKLREVGEFGFIDRLRTRIPCVDGILEGIGDDCAVLDRPGGPLLLCSDLFIEDVHFRRAYATPEDIGWKGASACLSDIAAMGGKADFALISMAAPLDSELEYVEAVYAGLGEALDAHGTVLVGGDTTRSTGGLVLDVIILGSVPGERYVTRHGGKIGDILLVTGHLGNSAAGFHAIENGNPAETLVRHHLRPTALLKEGQWLAQQPGVHAMIDVTDGLVQDTGHLIEHGPSGVDIWSDRLPVSHALREYSDANGLLATDFALYGGEDYELLIACGEEEVDTVVEQFGKAMDRPLHAIGQLIGGHVGVRVDGQKPASTGFDHFHPRET